MGGTGAAAAAIVGGFETFFADLSPEDTAGGVDSWTPPLRLPEWFPPVAATNLCPNDVAGGGEKVDSLTPPLRLSTWFPPVTMEVDSVPTD